jgi:hypothetical protein
VEVAERYADGEATSDQLSEAARAADPNFRWLSDAYNAASGSYRHSSLLDGDAPCAAYAAYNAVAPFTAAATDTRDFTDRAATAAATATAYSSSKFAAKRYQWRVWKESQQRAYAALCPLLRDLFGLLPSCEVRIEPAWLAWDNGTVRRLAEAAYEERQLPSGHLDPTRLGVLADALEEAGCPDAELLGHLRGPGPHVRGCFAADAVRGRS